MTLDEIKLEIEHRAGIPATILNGETAEEVIATAKALNAYRNQHKAGTPKSNAEKFAEWFNQGQPETDPAGEAISALEEELRIAGGGYPYTHDGGELTGAKANIGDGRPPREQFGEWLNNQTAFNPFKGNDKL